MPRGGSSSLPADNRQTAEKAWGFIVRRFPTAPASGLNLRASGAVNLTLQAQPRSGRSEMPLMLGVREKSVPAHTTSKEVRVQVIE